MWSFFGGYARGFVRGGTSALSTLTTGIVPVTSVGGSILGHLLVQSGTIPGQAACASWTCQQAYGAAHALASVQDTFAAPAANASWAAKTGDRIGAVHGWVSGMVGVWAASAGIGDLFAATEAVAAEGAGGAASRLVPEGYRIIDGTHRARAAVQLGVDTIDAEIYEADKLVGRGPVAVNELRSVKAGLDLSGKGLQRWLRALEEVATGKNGPIKVEMKPGGTPIYNVRLLRPRD